MARVNIGMLTFQEQSAIKYTLVENNNEMIGQKVEDDLIQAGHHQQEIETIQHAMNKAEEVVHEAEEERQALERKAGNTISLESLQRAIKSFERRTGVAYSGVILESHQELTGNINSFKIATEGVVEYVKKLITMLMKALNSVWDKVKEFFKNILSGAERLRRRAIKIKADTQDAREDLDHGKPNGEHSTIVDGEYIPSRLLEKSVNKESVSSARNALIMELNDRKLDSETLQAGLKWALSKNPEIAEKYEEKAFSRGMDPDKAKWDRQYYLMQEVYLGTSFTKERYLHMIDVREYLRDKGIKGFAAPDKKEASNQNPEISSKKQKSNSDKITLPSVLEFVVLNGKTTEGSSFVSQYEKQTSDKNRYRETVNDYINQISSGAYADVLEAAKKDNNEDEITKLIKDIIVGPGSNVKIIKDNKDGLIHYANSNDSYLLGDYCQEFINLSKDATWEQISNEYSKISFDLISKKREGKAEEVRPLSRKESNAVASAAINAMEKFKKLEEQQKKLGTGFNKLMTEAKRLGKDKSVSAEQLRVATGFVRTSVNAAIKMSVAVNAYELRLTKAALDYAAASLNIDSAA